MAYPTAEEVTARLEAEGFTSPDGGIVASKLAASIATFERMAGYAPFLGDSGETEHTFDPPGTNGIVTLRGGFWEVSSVESDGTELTENTDYVLLPTPEQCNRIEFVSHVSSKRRSIVVTGKRGYSEELPSDVFEAILNGAVGLAMTALATGDIASPTSIKQADITVSGASDGSSSKQTIYANDLKRVAESYRNLWY